MEDLAVFAALNHSGSLGMNFVKFFKKKYVIYRRYLYIWFPDNEVLSSRLITGGWAEYNASLPETTKWKAVAYLLSKICRSLRRSREEKASEQSE